MSQSRVAHTSHLLLPISHSHRAVVTNIDPNSSLNEQAKHSKPPIPTRVSMKEAIVRKDTSVDVVDVPIPTPGSGQVLIKVIVAGKYTFSLNPNP
jgi:hypothetical protein